MTKIDRKPLGTALEDGILEFEQPLLERMRTFLRIEFLYQQLLYHAKDLTGLAPGQQSEPFSRF